MRRSWRAGADCKSVGLSLRWFESTHSHQNKKCTQRVYFLFCNVGWVDAQERHGTTVPYENEIFVNNWRAWRIREYTIKKILKNRSVRDFFDFIYCVSRRTHSHQEMPTKYGRFFLCPNRADCRHVFRMFWGDNILYVYVPCQNTLFFQNYIQCRFSNWRFVAFIDAQFQYRIVVLRYILLLIDDGIVWRSFLRTADIFYQV